MNIEIEDKILISGSELISLELDGLPPTVNHMHMNVRGRVFRTKECKAYQDYVSEALSRLWASKPPYSGRCELDLIFTASNKRRWDIDNRVKSIQDCLTRAGIIKDDSQIDKLIVERVYGEISSTELILRSMS